MGLQRYHLGCPVWGRRDWVGHFVRADAKPSQYLEQYAQVFNAVEGNTTFYSVPSVQTLTRWSGATPEGFRFCFKFPRTVTHERRLLGPAIREALAFVERTGAISDRLGPTLVQLPPSFGPPALPDLERFVRELPSHRAYAVELRHPAFFTATGAHARLDAVLTELGIDRVIFDTEGLHAATTTNLDALDAQRQKPATPVCMTTTASSPVVRFIGDPDPSRNHARLRRWAQQIADWIAQGKTPYVFMHSANDFYAPQLCRTFHGFLTHCADVGSMPPWPAEGSGGKSEQISLF